MRYSLLNSIGTRRLFDPTREEDIYELKHYLDTSQWINGCPFYLEEYWDNIPAMCVHKYAKHILDQVKLPKKAKSPK